ncbi:MAG: hypothetical protein F4151_14770, partial [Gammaproteobacteria bacterium]|nr:hypothetical protein [Gammaproteobacteria bacterium]
PTPRPSPAPPAADLHPCARGIAVPSPEANPDLVSDCKVLLALKATLAGSAELDWSAEKPISFWEGIDVPRRRVDIRPRVAQIALVSRGLTGSIPPELTALTGLEQLVLDENELTGSIPPELGRMGTLTSLTLSRNRLTGTIPPELGELSNLQALHLQENELSGSIPPELGGLLRLQSLLLHENRLVGAVPAELGALTSLQLITLDRNPLTRCLWPPGANVAAAAVAALDIPECTESSVADTAPELTSSHQVSSVGEVEAGRLAELRAAVEDVAAFYAIGYGIEIPDFRLYFAPERESAGELYEEVTGRPSIFDDPRIAGVVVTTAEGSLAIIRYFEVEEEVDEARLDHVLSHEYHHLVQNAAVPPEIAGRTIVPRWIVEGAAEYGSGFFVRDKYGTDTLQRWVGDSLAYEETFREIAADFRNEHYGVAALAIEWLVRHSGNPRSYLQYWDLLGSGASWDDAFTSAFGLARGTFFDSFEEYRAGLRSSATRIRGVVVDPDGSGISGADVAAKPRTPYDAALTTFSASDGTFEMLVPPDTYSLSLGRRFLRNGMLFLAFDLKYDATHGYATACGPGTTYTTRAGEVVEVVIRVLPDLLGRADEPPCNEGVPGYHVIESTVTGPTGEPVAEFVPKTYHGVQVKAIPFPYRVTGHRFDGVVQSRGISRAAVEDGRYLLEILYHFGFYGHQRRVVGWYGNGGFTTDRDEATVIEVAGAGVAGIEIRLPAAPEELPGLFR